MRKLTVLVALVCGVAACAGPQAVPVSTGRMRLDGASALAVTAPATAARGDALAVEIVWRPRAGRELERDARLVLVPVAGGVEVVVAPYDPSAGMPDPPPPPGAPPPEPTSQVRVAFPLATRWDEIAEGRYTAHVVVEGTPELRSAPFALAVTPPPAREVRIDVPRALLDGARGDTGTSPVVLSARNGFFAALRYEITGAAPDDETGGMCGPDAATLARLAGYLRADPRCGVTAEIFETAESPEHMWHPGAGRFGYRTLWKTAIAPAAAR